MYDHSADTFSNKLARVDRFFSAAVDGFKQRLSELDAEIPPSAIPHRNDAFHRRVHSAFQQSQDDCRRFEEANRHDPSMIEHVQQRFREETDPWFSRSWIAQRARSKPSGFAGDFEMLIKLYEEATPARGLGGYLDLCILELPLARAVRARLTAAHDFLVREIATRSSQVRVLDIACGPCREYRDWPRRKNGPQVEVVAMDNDPKALAYVNAAVATKLSDTTNLRTVRYNALRTRSASANKRNFGRFDIIYSVGLCDYLSDEHLIRMFGGWRDTLNDGGVLYIAFKDTERYDQTPYQWHLDWFFFQRTRNDVFNLFKRAGFDVSAMETTRDGTGIITNFISRHQRKTIVRTDVAEDIVRRLGGSSISEPAPE